MAREKIEIKKIEKRAARHVTFSKRRKGLMKKAKELSILCETDLGLIVFSAKGKLFEYSSSGMKMILEKYSKCLNATLNNEQFNLKLDNEDVRRIKQEVEDIDCTLRHMHGEDLEGLTTKKLQQLEKMLEAGLNRIRMKKADCLLKEISELRKKGKQYVEENDNLRLQVNEKRCSPVENSNAVRSLFIEPSEIHDHPRSPETTVHIACNLSVCRENIEDNEASDTSLQLQLGLSI